MSGLGPRHGQRNISRETSQSTQTSWNRHTGKRDVARRNGEISGCVVDGDGINTRGVVPVMSYNSVWWTGLPDYRTVTPTSSDLQSLITGMSGDPNSDAIVLPRTSAVPPQ